MKTRITAAALMMAALPLTAQRTGVSNPDPVAIDTNSDATPSVQPAPAKPSAAKPAQPEVYGTYVPYQGVSTGTASAAVASPSAVSASVGDVDAQIVTSVPERAGEIGEGTLLRVRMLEEISTAQTAPGTKFTAEVMEPVMNMGHVVIPIGSILDGQVTEVHAGKRISGAAALHLEPRSITLPDGTIYTLHAQLIDTTLNSFNVDREGTLKRRDRAKETVGVAALTTGAGAATGAMLAGGVGALVGAGVGAGATTVMWLKQERQATLNKDSRLVFSLTTPLMIKPMHAAGVDGSRTGPGPALRAVAQ